MNVCVCTLVYMRARVNQADRIYIGTRMYVYARLYICVCIRMEVVSSSRSMRTSESSGSDLYRKTNVCVCMRERVNERETSRE